MSPEIKDWRDHGGFMSFGPFGHKVFYRDIGDTTASADDTLLLLHGFPESSYSYHAVIDDLADRFKRIVLYDMLGYGLSDKPTEGYTYSLFEQADLAFAVWKELGVTGGHLLSHDMGDSVSTEIVARRENGLLPGFLSEDLRSLTYTNGSMVLGLADLRITQKLLLSRYGRQFNKITTFKVFTQQVKSAHGNANLSDQDVALLWELNTLQEGHRKTYLTIKYLNDRGRFEATRWLPALSKTPLPVHLCWGDEDAVARVAMAHHLKEKVCKDATLTIMKGLGHFCQMGSPKVWSEHVLRFYD